MIFFPCAASELDFDWLWLCNFSSARSGGTGGAQVCTQTLSWLSCHSLVLKPPGFNPHMDHLPKSWTGWSLCVPSSSEYSMNLWIDQTLGPIRSTKPLLLQFLMQAQHIRWTQDAQNCALAYPSLKQDLIWTLFECISIHILPLFLNISSWKHIKMAIYGNRVSAGWNLPA